MDTNNYILLSKELIDTMEKSANAKLQNNSNRPLSEASIEARSVLSVIRYIRDNNVYEKMDQGMECIDSSLRTIGIRNYVSNVLHIPIEAGVKNI